MFHPRWTSEDEVLTIISMERLAWERPAQQSLVSLMDLMPNLQCPVEVDVFLSLNGRRICCWPLLVHIITCYYMFEWWWYFLTIIIPEGVEARSQCPWAAASHGHLNGYDRREEVVGWGFGNLQRETSEESWQFSSGGSAARGACRTALRRWQPSLSTSRHPNRCCLVHHQAAGGWYHVAAMHGPRYCSGCRGSGPGNRAGMQFGEVNKITLWKDSTRSK